MSTHSRRSGAPIAAWAVAVFIPQMALGEPVHGIAMYGEPVLPPDFVSLPYVNPNAPKGGSVSFAEVGGFDSLNPFILKGDSVYGHRVYGFESLMGRSWDEPFTLYGLLAESVETPPERNWVEFTLRENARFSDGTSVTPEDVLWSFETLGTLGHPRYHGAWDKVETAEIIGPRTLRFTFSEIDRELPLILGLRPVLKKDTYANRPFDESSLEPPIGSGPYTVGNFEPGRFLTLVKDPDWWGADLPFNRGQHNIDEIRYEWFGDGDVAFEAFRAGEIDSVREFNIAKWNTAYDFPAVQDGTVVRSMIAHQRPSGIAGFVMNTRRAPFDDWRVRDAMIHAFNFEFINAAINAGEQPRVTSYFSNSVLAMADGPAEGRVAELLAPFEEELLPGALEGYSLPVSDGSEANRRNTRAAIALLEDAGYSVQDGVMTSAEGVALEFTLLLQSQARQPINTAEIYVTALERIGVVARIETIDATQFRERAQVYDFDMTYYTRPVTLSPGNEQMLYWGCDGVTEDGTRNWMGMCSQAAEAMINEILTAESQEDFRAAVQALDRVLTTGRYVVPIWHSPQSRLAHKAWLRFPEETLPMYGDWIGFLPDIWWVEE